MSDHGNPTTIQVNPMLPIVREHLKSMTEWHEFAKGVGNEREGADLGQWDTDRQQSVVRAWLDEMALVLVRNNYHILQH
jgi:hypothetical protein